MGLTHINTWVNKSIEITRDYERFKRGAKNDEKLVIM